MKVPKNQKSKLHRNDSKHDVNLRLIQPYVSLCLYEGFLLPRDEDFFVQVQI